MGTTKKDIFKYPVYLYKNGRLIRIYPNNAYHNIFEMQYHHYIMCQWIKRNPIKFKQIEHLQKLFLIPVEMHMDIHNRHSHFKQKWGIAPEKLLYNYRDKSKENEIS